MKTANLNLKLNKVTDYFNWPVIGRVVLASMSYLFILAIFPYIFGRKNNFIFFHAKQGIALLVVWALLLFSFYVLFLPWLIALALVILIVIGIVNCVRQKERALPVIGKLVF